MQIRERQMDRALTWIFPWRSVWSCRLRRLRGPRSFRSRRSHARAPTPEASPPIPSHYGPQPAACAPAPQPSALLHPCSNYTHTHTWWEFKICSDQQTFTQDYKNMYLNTNTHTQTDTWEEFHACSARGGAVFGRSCYRLILGGDMGTEHVDCVCKPHSSDFSVGGVRGACKLYWSFLSLDWIWMVFHW